MGVDGSVLSPAAVWIGKCPDLRVVSSNLGLCEGICLIQHNFGEVDAGKPVDDAALSVFIE